MFLKFTKGKQQGSMTFAYFRVMELEMIFLYSQNLD